MSAVCLTMSQSRFKLHQIFYECCFVWRSMYTSGFVDDVVLFSDCGPNGGMSLYSSYASFYSFLEEFFLFI